MQVSVKYFFLFPLFFITAGFQQWYQSYMFGEIDFYMLYNVICLVYLFFHV